MTIRHMRPTVDATKCTGNIVGLAMGVGFPLRNPIRTQELTEIGESAHFSLIHPADADVSPAEYALLIQTCRANSDSLFGAVR